MYGKSQFYYACKRLIDIAGAFTGLTFSVLLVVPVAIAIKINSRGPIFFRQIRLKKNAKPFIFYKFRTMLINAGLTDVERDMINEMGGPHFKSRLDPRITEVGRFLRTFSIDELPQFWNVLKGDMSLVGPRPPLKHEYDKYSQHEKKRLSVKPGVTGLWQISGRSKRTFEEMIELDLLYIQKAGVIFDLYIILATIPAVVLRKGAW
ncbi:MAG: sugar transferase [Fibrobacteres bacterium]|nr:sugar transferase [Fibrobacterota bacterium]